jgi:predicted transcriptional regulator
MLSKTIERRGQEAKGTLSIYAPASLRQELQRRAEQEDRSVSAIARRALAAYLRREMK